MPELPEVEVLRRTLEPHLVGQRLGAVEVRHRGLREPVDEAALRAAEGHRVLAVRRRAKYLLIDLDGGLTLLVHLGMSGRLTVVPTGAPAEPHEHVVIELRGRPRRQLRFRDPRRFGLFAAVPTAALGGDRRLSGLGLEPLAGGLDGEALRRLAARRRGPVKSFLMDGRLLVGVGNIYASESLHRAGIHPVRSVARLSPARWESLATAVREVLTGAIGEGGTTLNDFADGEGRSGGYQGVLSVYDRAGEPCRRCGRLIRRLTQGGRSTFYCPGCQR